MKTMSVRIADNASSSSMIEPPTFTTTTLSWKRWMYDSASTSPVALLIAWSIATATAPAHVRRTIGASGAWQAPRKSLGRRQRPEGRKEKGVSLNLAWAGCQRRVRRVWRDLDDRGAPPHPPP